MEHFQDEKHYVRDTPFEKRYLPYIQSIPESKQNEIARSLVPIENNQESSSSTPQFMNPHMAFVEAYNKRYLKNKNMESKRKSQKLYNENGKRFAKHWDFESYKAVHDPLSK